MVDPVIELDAEQAALRRRDAAWVRQCLTGDQRAFGHLYDAWFDRVFDLVNRVVRDRDVAAEVAQEAFFSAWRNLSTLEKPESFGGWLLRIARNGAYNRSQKEQRSYAVDDEGLTVIESVGASSSGAPSGFGVEDRLGRAVTPGAAVEDAEIVSLVWQAAEALPERDVEVLDLQLRHGLTPAEIGDVMGMNRNAANQLVHRLKGRLETAIRARVLWRGGAPSCAILAQRLRDLGIERFSAEAVKVAERHVPGCVECDERQRLNLEPAALFAAVPLLAVPIAIKQAAAVALAAGGVPMGGSAFLAAAGIAGQAVGGVGSAVGGAVDPGLGANVGHAIGGSNPAIGSNVGHAVGGSSSPLGSEVGSSLGGSSGAGAPGSTVGSAAGQSIAPPTPIESAASYVGDVAAVDKVADAAASFAGPPGPPAPIPSPPPPPPGGGSASSAKVVVLGAAAAVVVLVLLFAGGMWWGTRDSDVDLTATGTPITAQGSVPSTVTTTPQTSATDPATTVPGETTTSNPGDPTTSTAGGAPTTTPPTQATSPTTTPQTSTPSTTTRGNPTTTTQPTTTTTFVPDVTISVSPGNGDTNGWIHESPTTRYASDPRTLTWSVTPSTGYSVEVTGPGSVPYPAPGPAPMAPATAASGSVAICPGSIYTFNTANMSIKQCLPVQGTHTYTVTVKDGAGQVVISRSATLVVTQAPIVR